MVETVVVEQVKPGDVVIVDGLLWRVEDNLDGHLVVAYGTDRGVLVFHPRDIIEREMH